MTHKSPTTCPICQKAVEPDAPYYPFCSKAHADVDLNRWLSEVYRIETDEAPDLDDLPPDIKNPLKD